MLICWKGMIKMVTMTRTDLTQKVIELISMYTKLNDKEISPDTAIGLLGIDSLGLVNVLLDAEATFGIFIEITEHEFPPSFSINDMANMIIELQGKDLEEDSQITDFQQDTLPEEGSEIDNSQQGTPSRIDLFER